MRPLATVTEATFCDSGFFIVRQGSSTVTRCALATSVLGWIVVSSGGFPLGARVPFLSRVEASYHKLSPRRPAGRPPRNRRPQIADCVSAHHRRRGGRASNLHIKFSAPASLVLTYGRRINCVPPSLGDLPPISLTLSRGASASAARNRQRAINAKKQERQRQRQTAVTGVPNIASVQSF